MTNFIKSVPRWSWSIIVGTGTLLALIVSLVTIWNEIENNTDKAIKHATTLITTEIHSQTSEIIKVYEVDLAERIFALSSEIAELERENKNVPSHMRLMLFSMKKRLEDISNQ